MTKGPLIAVGVLAKFYYFYHYLIKLFLLLMNYICQYFIVKYLDIDCLLNAL